MFSLWVTNHSISLWILGSCRTLQAKDSTQDFSFSVVLNRVGQHFYTEISLEGCLLLLLSGQCSAIEKCLKTNFLPWIFSSIAWMSSSTRIAGEGCFLTRAIFDQLHFSPSEFLGFLTTLHGKRHVPQQIPFVCQQLGKRLFLGKLVPVYYDGEASPGQSFPNCGLQSPKDLEWVQRGALKR